MRIGHGYDVHRLVSGRPCIIGGVNIPFELGLDGHSDADVLTHAVMDSLLGALALGDIGKHFPDTDPRYKGADSIALLRHVAALVRESGWQLGNLDATVLAQAPKLAPHILQMRENLAAAIGCAVEQVSVKATTEEGLGFTGSKQGIAALRVPFRANLNSLTYTLWIIGVTPHSGIAPNKGSEPNGYTGKRHSYHEKTAPVRQQAVAGAAYRYGLQAEMPRLRA